MKTKFLFLAALALLALRAEAQPSFTAPPPSREVVADASARRAAYEGRVKEVLDWYLQRATPGQPFSLGTVLVKLARKEDPQKCSEAVVALMKEPGSGPFWMFPSVALSYLGRGQLSPEAQKALRETWRTTRQIRGDTENHWAMYYTSLYLISELYPDEPSESWYTGKSSSENLAEAREYLLHWMDLTTTVGQGEFTPMHYIGEYVIPMLYLASWAKDPEMRRRGQMMLDWLFAELAANSLDGVLRGTNARADEGTTVERWNALASYFSWLLFGNTPPPEGFGGFGVYFALAAEHYQVPEVIYRIAVDRSGDYLQQDLKRTRRRWRNSPTLWAPIYKTTYMRRDYAVGSYQGGVADGIQTHVWEVSWTTPDPRGVHCTMFSLHPHSSGEGMQTYFCTYPEPMVRGVMQEGKPTYDLPEKILGSSPYEQVFQDLDTVVALYDIPPGTRFPHINGFFSKDLAQLSEDSSGWIFAIGGRAYLAYRPLAPYDWQPYGHYKSGWAKAPVQLGGKLLHSPYLKNGTIVQAASASDYADFEAFKKAVRALPLSFGLEPTPSVRFRTLRGHEIRFTYGKTPELDGHEIDYSRWKLFGGAYLNAERGSRRLVISHGALERVLDFNTVTIVDRSRTP